MTITRTHKETGWKRTTDGRGIWTITPTDDSGPRTVAFMGAGSWANYPQDDRANIERDRVVLLAGEQLPDWANSWLETVNHRSCERGREALRAAIDDADAHFWNQDGW